MLYRLVSGSTRMFSEKTENRFVWSANYKANYLCFLLVPQKPKNRNHSFPLTKTDKPNRKSKQRNCNSPTFYMFEHLHIRSTHPHYNPASSLCIQSVGLLVGLLLVRKIGNLPLAIASGKLIFRGGGITAFRETRSGILYVRLSGGNSNIFM